LAKKTLLNLASSSVMVALAMSGATSWTRRSRLLASASARTSARVSCRVESYWVGTKPPTVALATASSAGTGGPYCTCSSSSGRISRSASSGAVKGVICSRKRSVWQPAAASAASAAAAARTEARTARRDRTRRRRIGSLMAQRLDGVEP
jgi:hypothetical protein